MSAEPIIPANPGNSAQDFQKYTQGKTAQLLAMKHHISEWMTKSFIPVRTNRVRYCNRQGPT